MFNNYNTPQQPPATNNSNSSSNDNIVSVKKYLGHLFLFVIPVVGFILLIVKAVDNKDKNITNYARAQLLFAGILTVILVIISIIAGISITNSISDSVNDSYYDISNDYNYDY